MSPSVLRVHRVQPDAELVSAVLNGENQRKRGSSIKKKMNLTAFSKRDNYDRET